MIQVAEIFIQEENRDLKMWAIDWFSFLVYQGQAYKEAKDALLQLAREQDQIDTHVIELMLHLMVKTHADPESFLSMGYLQKQQDQKLFLSIHSLLHAQPETVSEILEKSSPISMNQIFDVCKTLIDRNRIHSKKYFLLCEIAKKDPRFILPAFNAIYLLFNEKRIQKEAIEMIQIVLKNIKGADHSFPLAALQDAIVMLMTLVSQGKAYDEAKAAVAELFEQLNDGCVRRLFSNLKEILNYQEEIQKAQLDLEKIEFLTTKVQTLLERSQDLLFVNYI
jgi:hypothetical protein